MATWLTIPRIDARYWLAILFASIFGTNVGDLYAHESGLGIGLGLAILAAIVAALFALARVTPGKVELFYWLVIAIIRTGATNISDSVLHNLRSMGLFGLIPIVVIALLLPLFAWLHQRGKQNADGALPPPDGNYWAAMLAAGVFGTMYGDLSQFIMGHGGASLVLTGLLGALLWFKGVTFKSVAVYWTILGLARTAGTAVGDWLAEDKVLAIGLPTATLISGACLVLILLFWPRSAALKTAQA